MSRLASWVPGSMAAGSGVLAGLAVVMLACGGDGRPPETTPAGPQPEAWLVDVAGTAGVDFVHVRAETVRYWLPEIMSGGGCWLDFDGDGDLDLYLVQGGVLAPATPPGPRNRLYRNDAGGDGARHFVEVGAAAGVDDGGYGMGCAAGDFDGDGATDLYLTNVGANRLLRNRGDGTFADVTLASGTGHPGWGSSAAFFDLEGDGDLDLFVVNYINWSADNELECFAGDRERDYCHPLRYNAPATDVLYRNRGDGTFTDVSLEAGLQTAFGNGLGVAPGDFDLDGRTDIYVANDGMPNQLWMNRADGRLEDEALMAGAAVNVHGAAEAGMGVAPADLDRDGDLDLFMTHLRDETNTLYRNQGGVFRDTTAVAGLGGPSVPWTGFGTGLADLDLDGLLDLYVGNGRVGRGKARRAGEDPFAEPNQLFRGLEDGSFQEVRPPGGTARTVVDNSRAVLFGDYDEDGDVDLAVVNNGESARLLENLASGAWSAVRVLDATGGDAVGSRVRVSSAGRVQWSQVQPAYSYCAANDPRVHFGLAGAQELEELLALRPDGRRQLWRRLPARVQLILF